MPRPPARPPDRRGRLRRVVPLVLVVAMVATALFAAYTVTPRPDEESLARPDATDLVIAGSMPASWDPAAISDAASAQMLAQVYEGLTVLDAEAQLRPALAEAWTVADDGLSATFRLRPDLRFSDGTPIGAEDVRRSWLRFLDPERPSPFTSLLDDVVGAAAYAAGEAREAQVGIEADGLDVTVRFVRPGSYFPSVAAVPGLAVVPPGHRRQPSRQGRHRRRLASWRRGPMSRSRPCRARSSSSRTTTTGRARRRSSGSRS